MADLEKGILAAGFRLLDISIRHAATVPEMDMPHSDPIDRMLLAQCEVETLRLVTADHVLSAIPGVITV